MRTVILEKKMDEFGELIGESWKHQKALDPSVTNPQIASLFETAMSAGALNGKACGAGGGGCLLFYTTPVKQSAVADAVAQEGARVIPFKVDFKGLQITKEGQA